MNDGYVVTSCVMVVHVCVFDRAVLRLEVVGSRPSFPLHIHVHYLLVNHLMLNL